MRVVIEKDGTLRMIYTDSLDVRDMGESEIWRVGRVEPTEDSQWEVEVTGKAIGRFSLREEALREEVRVVEGML